MFPAGPPICLGGTLSGYLYLNVQENGLLYSKDIIHVNQESKITSATAQKQNMAQEIPINAKKRKKRSVSRQKQQHIFDSAKLYLKTQSQNQTKSLST